MNSCAYADCLLTTQWSTFHLKLNFVSVCQAVSSPAHAPPIQQMAAGRFSSCALCNSCFSSKKKLKLYSVKSALKVFQCESLWAFLKSFIALQSDWIKAIWCPGDANYPEAIEVCVNQNQYACKLDMAQFIWVHPYK